MIQITKLASIVSLALLLSASTLTAKENVVSAKQIVTQKDASALLKKSYNYIGALQKYAFDATVITTIADDTNEIVTKRYAEVKVQRDGMFRIDTKGKYINRSLYLAKGQFSMIDNDEKYYISVKSGTNIDATLDYISRKLGIALPLATLIHSDMTKSIKPRRVQYFGTKVIDGVTCNYIAFKQRKTTVHLWIEDSETPVIRFAKITTPGAGTTDMILKWDTQADFSDTAFMFKAPKGASNVSIKSAN